MKNLLFGFFLLVVCSSASAKPVLSERKQARISGPVSEIVKEIASHNIYESRTVGIAGTLSAQFQRYEKLGKTATPDELIQISTNHENAVVRIYAFQALKLRGIAVPKDLQEQISRDKAEVQTLDGCLGGVSTVGKLSKEDVVSQGSLTPVQSKGQK